MKFTLEREGLLDPRQLDAWRKKRVEQIHRGVALGMQDAASRIVPRIRAQAASVFKFRRAATLRTFSATVYARRKEVLPVVDFYSKIPWMGIHERGGVIQGPVLIPLTEEGKRMGRKTFKRVITGLLAQGNAFFKNVNGKVILFAENIRESGKFLTRFRKAYRTRSGVQKGARLARNIDIPIAILLPRVELKKRLRMIEIVQRNLPLIATSIEKRVANG